TSGVSGAKTSLALLIENFKRSELNRDLCSRGLEITQKSIRVLDRIEELSKKFSEYQEQNIHSDLVLHKAGAFERFLESNKELQRFANILWEILLFEYETINYESVEARDEMKRLIEELNSATTNLQDAIEKWRSNHSMWSRNMKTKIIALVKIKNIMKKSSSGVKCYEIPAKKLEPTSTSDIASQEHTSPGPDDTEKNSTLRGSRKHVRQYWYLGHKVAEKSLGSFDGIDKISAKLDEEIGFMNELRKQSSSFYILRFFGYCLRSDSFSVICEWEDYNLQTYLASHVELDWKEKLSIARGIADALVNIHEKNILHYDVRTENVLLDRHFLPKLYNFRIKKDSPVMLTASDAPIDDPRYSSPERIKGEVYNKASEVYSFAMVMWEIQHHQKPYADLTANQIKTKILAGEYPELAPMTGTPKEFQRIMEQAWSFSSGERPSTQSLYISLNELYLAYLSLQVKLIGVEEASNNHASNSLTRLDSISNGFITRNNGFSKSYNPFIEKSPEIENGIRYHNERNYKKAWKIFREYENRSHDPEAMYWVGYYYMKGLHDKRNKKPDRVKGMSYLSTAASLDHAESQFLYATTILKTSQAAKEHENNRYNYAICCLKKAAAHNHPKALRDFGEIIKYGKYNQKKDASLGNKMIERVRCKNRGAKIAKLGQFISRDTIFRRELKAYAKN
ncbi:370_t:CDS:2, partial [Acaulospora colombiana]